MLQVLQDRTFIRVGSHTQKRFEGRVIAATNRSIKDLRGQEAFRDDFFYRLCSDIITVPTLRQRIEESPAELEQMVNLLIKRMTGHESPELVDMALVALKKDLPEDYGWPGNVRELEQAIRSILLTRHYHGDIMLNSTDLEENFVQTIQTGSVKVRELINQYCTLLYHRLGTYEKVAQKTGLDSRTVKKYLKKQQ